MATMRATSSGCVGYSAPEGSPEIGGVGAAAGLQGAGGLQAGAAQGADAVKAAAAGAAHP